MIHQATGFVGDSGRSKYDIIAPDMEKKEKKSYSIILLTLPVMKEKISCKIINPTVKKDWRYTDAPHMSHSQGPKQETVNLWFSLQTQGWRKKCSNLLQLLCVTKNHRGSRQLAPGYWKKRNECVRRCSICSGRKSCAESIKITLLRETNFLFLYSKLKKTL